MPSACIRNTVMDEKGVRYIYAFSRVVVYQVRSSTPLKVVHSNRWRRRVHASARARTILRSLPLSFFLSFFHLLCLSTISRSYFLLFLFTRLKVASLPSNAVRSVWFICFRWSVHPSSCGAFFFSPSLSPSCYGIINFARNNWIGIM